MIHLDASLECSDCGVVLGDEDFKAVLRGRGAVGQAVYFVRCIRCIARAASGQLLEMVASGW